SRILIMIFPASISKPDKHSSQVRANFIKLTLNDREKSNIIMYSRKSSPKNFMEKLMGSHYDFDLTYITERIISDVAGMLKSKHQGKLNPKVEEFGWPDLHAPSLDKICAVCKTMENRLNSDPQNVVVLYCKVEIRSYLIFNI
uniref:Uncharacterized protein n=1 Tax=Cyprinus carpio TaxID=7962 RepID=A0A8C1YIJ2_CYPCA